MMRTRVLVVFFGAIYGGGMIVITSVTAVYLMQVACCAVIAVVSLRCWWWIMLLYNIRFGCFLFLNDGGVVCFDNGGYIAVIGVGMGDTGNMVECSLLLGGRSFYSFVWQVWMWRRGLIALHGGGPFELLLVLAGICEVAWQ